MLEEAIELISKQREMYIIQINNLQNYIRTKAVQKVINKTRRQIQVLDFILKILNKQNENKKQRGTNEQVKKGRLQRSGSAV